MVIEGKKIADDIIMELKNLPKIGGFLGAVIVGDDSASLSFLAQKEKSAKSLEMDFRLYRFPAEISQDDLRGEILNIANHKTCGGVIVQLPLPAHINPNYVLNAIPREKDVDVLGERALGAFYAGRNPVLPPAVATVEKILAVLNLPLAGSDVAVVGLGSLVGKPISLWLERRCRDLYLLRRGSDFSVIGKADLVITGTGAPHLIDESMLKKSAVVIDFGYGRIDGGIAGDFNPPSSDNDSSIVYTPTPGGTGPILVASLLKNFYILNS